MNIGGGRKEEPSHLCPLGRTDKEVPGGWNPPVFRGLIGALRFYGKGEQRPRVGVLPSGVEVA